MTRLKKRISIVLCLAILFSVIMIPETIHAEETPIVSVRPGDIPTVSEEPVQTPDVLTEDEKTAADIFSSNKIAKVKINNSIEKAVKLTWKKQSDSAGYKVFRSSKKKSGYKLIGTTKKTSFTDKKAKKRKTYYYKIKAYMNIREHLIEGKESSTKSLYVFPKKPKTVIAGECFVEGMKMVKNQFPKNINLVAKIGVNTYSMMHSNYFVYNGQSITGLERIAYYYPDRVYFLIGANESAWAKPSFTISNFKKMYKMLKKINKHVQIVLIKIAPFGWHSSQHIPSVSARATFNKAYADFAGKYKNIYYCNATDVLDDGTSHLNKRYDDGDGCHWNTTGTIQVIKRLKKWSKAKFKSL